MKSTKNTNLMRTERGRASLHPIFAARIQSVKAWPVRPLNPRSVRLEVTEKIPQGTPLLLLIERRQPGVESAVLNRVDGIGDAHRTRGPTRTLPFLLMDTTLGIWLLSSSRVPFAAKKLLFYPEGGWHTCSCGCVGTPFTTFRAVCTLPH